jgi:hypothetical protein
MLTREIGGRTWYVEARAYPTAIMAKRAWERAERKLIRGPGEEGIGITRLAPNPAGGLSSGLEGGHAVIVVTLDERMLTKAQRLLSDGRVWEPHPELVDAMIARRARVVVGQAGSGEGRVVIRRPEQRGAEFNRLGEVFEAGPGQG